MKKLKDQVDLSNLKNKDFLIAVAIIALPFFAAFGIINFIILG